MVENYRDKHGKDIKPMGFMTKIRDDHAVINHNHVVMHVHTVIIIIMTLIVMRPTRKLSTGS